MKLYIPVLMAALALTACGDDKPKKKKHAVKAASVAEVAAPVVTPQNQNVVQTPTETVTEPTPVSLPTDEQSGYKAYIEQPVAEAQQPVVEPAPAVELLAASAANENVPARDESGRKIIYPGLYDLPPVIRI